MTSQGGFSFLVHSNDEVIALQHKSFETKSPEDQIDNIRKIINDDFIIKHKIDEAQLIFDNPLFTNVPDLYFEEDQTAHYLKYNAELLAGDYIDYDNVTPLKLKVIYIPIMNIYNYLVEKIGNVGYKHQMSTLLNAVKPDSDQKEYIFINKYVDNCYILAYYKGKCHLANRFKIQTDEDVAYYLLSVIDQLKFDRENLQLVISGFIKKEDQAYHYLYDYIRKINFYRPSFAPEHFLFDTITYKETNLVCHYLSE